MKKIFIAANLFVFAAGCSSIEPEKNTTLAVPDSIITITSTASETTIDTLPLKTIPGTSAPARSHKSNLLADSIVDFAQTLIGIPYKYGSVDPAEGFDCSGFITYVFNHFHIKVPRSSIGFTNVGEEISLQDSKKGDLILFTGTDSTEKDVGHMGIIVSHDNGIIRFIHSTSGKAYGVTITPLNDYYMGRFVKVVGPPLRPPLNLPR
jgi:cell wall-associated NlpC family hydrolase